MAESVAQRVNALSNPKDRAELVKLLGAVVASLKAICAKLDADSGVGSTDYAETLAAIVRE